MLHQTLPSRGLTRDVRRCSRAAPAPVSARIGRRHLRIVANVKDDALWDKPIQSNPSGSLSSMTGDPYIKISRVEESRKYWRTVYDFPQWEKHRKQSRLIDRLLTIPQSHVLKNIVPSLAWVGSISALICLYMYAYDNGSLPEGWANLHVNLASQAFISTTSIALSLLLVFRTNTSYSRWDEARKMWGGLLNRSRDIMRQGATMIPEEDIEAKKALARWTVALARVLRIHFQPEVTLDSELHSILEPSEVQALKNAPHRPVFALHCLSQVVQNSAMSDVEQYQMSANLTFFQDVLGGCERLLRAPIPLSYTRHTARFLFLWLSILPFSLYPSLDVWTIPTVIAISGVLCGIEEIGVQIEEPFGILPLDVICNRIQADVMNTLNNDLKLKAVMLESLSPGSDQGSLFVWGNVDASANGSSVAHGALAAMSAANSAPGLPEGMDQAQYEALLASEEELRTLDNMLLDFAKQADASLGKIDKVLGSSR